MLKNYKSNNKKRFMATTLALTLAFPSAIPVLNSFETMATETDSASVNTGINYGELTDNVLNKATNLYEELTKAGNATTKARQLYEEKKFDMSDCMQIYNWYDCIYKAYMASLDVYNKLDNLQKNWGNAAISESDENYNKYIEEYNSYIEANNYLESLENTKAEADKNVSEYLEKLEKTEIEYLNYDQFTEEINKKVANLYEEFTKAENNMTTARQLVMEQKFDMSDFTQIYDGYIDTHKAYMASIDVQNKLENLQKHLGEADEVKYYSSYVDAKNYLQTLEDLKAATEKNISSYLEKLENAKTADVEDETGDKEISEIKEDINSLTENLNNDTSIQ